MEGCWLPGANFIEATLAGADLNYSNFWGAFFVHATLDNTNFDDVNLTYAYFDETGDCEGDWSISCDGYDDISYDACAESIDTNSDGLVDEFPVITV